MLRQTFGEPEYPQAALLVSYYYRKTFDNMKDDIHFRDWVLDSGAFSAHNSGKTIDLQEFIDYCLAAQEADEKLTQVFGLDVIGDPEASMRNCEEMVRQGVDATPTFHMGSPWEALEEFKKYPRIALGGMVGRPGNLKKDWLEQAFARLWPKRIHAFGVASRDVLMTYPFHSADASNWEIAPCAFGTWKTYGKNFKIKGGDINLQPEIKRYLTLEKELEHRWRKELATLSKLPTEIQ
jgi:hypothetical protein